MNNYIKIGIDGLKISMDIEYDNFESIKTLLYSLFSHSLDEILKNMIINKINSGEFCPEISDDQLQVLLYLISYKKTGELNLTSTTEMPIIKPSEFS